MRVCICTHVFVRICLGLMLDVYVCARVHKYIHIHADLGRIHSSPTRVSYNALDTYTSYIHTYRSWKDLHSSHIWMSCKSKYTHIIHIHIHTYIRTYRSWKDLHSSHTWMSCNAEIQLRPCLSRSLLCRCVYVKVWDCACICTCVYVRICK